MTFMHPGHMIFHDLSAVGRDLSLVSQGCINSISALLKSKARVNVAYDVHLIIDHLSNLSRSQAF